MLKKLFSWILIAIQMLGSLIFGLPSTPRGDAIDLSKFDLVWKDEFDTSEIDNANWSGHYTYGDDASPRRDGYWQRGMATVEDGNLHIKTQYIEGGLGGGPSGYYSYGMDTNGKYMQKFGYFEVRCILPKGAGLWSAFWMMNDGMYVEDGSGQDGSEIDIFESPYFSRSCLMKNAVTANIHYDSYGSNHKMKNIGKFYVNEPYDTFNTYGLEWNEDEYIIYVNGIEAGRSSFGGVSQNPEYMILSVEVEKDGWAGAIEDNDYLPADFVVDYVRAYQYK